MHTNIHSIFSSYKLEITETSINKRKDKQNFIYPYSEIIINNKEEQAIDLCDMGGSQNNYTEWEKLGKIM